MATMPRSRRRLRALGQHLGTQCPGCPAAVSNPNPLEVTLPGGTKALLLHYDTMNHPSAAPPGIARQRWSQRSGSGFGGVLYHLSLSRPLAPRRARARGRQRQRSGHGSTSLRSRLGWRRDA